ncbi:MAG: FtsQ-type POTRA domain-containing protein [Clostridia bacterium]|nr:FtsQ-type POTRA domain-containing protein [Clostridia bacterium]
MTTPAQRRKKNRQIKRRKRIIKTLKFIIIIGAIYAFIFCTPFFNVKNIEVEGATATSAQSVITASGITEGQHVLKINKKKAASGIEKLAYIKSAEIKRVFPNRIKITVEEGKVCALIALSNGFAAIDETGKVMEISEQPKVSPIVYGLTSKKSEVGEKISIDETTQFDVILKYIAQLNGQALVIPYTSLTLNGDDVWVELENGILVRFGNDDEIDYKVAAFAESLRNAGNIKEGYFDVTTPDRIVYSATLPGSEETTEQEENPVQTTDEPSAEQTSDE